MSDVLNALRRKKAAYEGAGLTDLAKRVDKRIAKLTAPPKAKPKPKAKPVKSEKQGD